MKINLNIIIFSISILFIIGCKNTISNNTVYFTGQIINPKEKQIHIYKGDEEIYTSNIENNQFFIKLNHLKEGLYTFKHGVEFQYLYLEPNDSIVMRINTWDFDESLTFNGIGSEKNNFLIQQFLQNEKDEKQFDKYYKLEENDFIKKTDSLVKISLKKYSAFKIGKKTSKNFDDLVNTIINFPVYSIKEKYQKNYKHLHKLKNNKPLSKHFYNFRKKIDINDQRFINYFSFRNYIGNYLLNVSNEIKNKDTSKQLSSIVLKQINKKIKNGKLKNAMLHNAILNCLLDKKSCVEDKDESKNIFYTNCTDLNKIDKVKTFEKSLHLLKKDTKLPVLNVLNFNHEKIELNNFYKYRKRVIYFWPKEINRIQYMAKRVHYLSKEYPEILFIGVDSQLNNNKWRKLIKATHLTKKNQFQLIDSVQNKWFINEIPRAIVLNSKSIIQNDFSFLSHQDFEKILLKF